MTKFSKERLDIRPKVSIYRLFSRLNYKPYYAIAEFVDNSTASFFGMERTLKFYNIKSTTIKIDYDDDLNELTIEDDAYGMEIEDFRRAILLGAKPENLNGRNEFGMGLKTAASWFGDVWSVRSTQLNSEVEYFAEVDIPYMDEHDLNEVEIQKFKTDKTKHGTVIKIKQLTKSIKSRRTKNKIKNHLSSMYRRDLKKNVKIIFNGEELFFKDYKVLQFRDKIWEKIVNFTFEFEDKKYNVDGKVGILNPGSFDKAGFALFRNNRVILGGEGENYKPYSIFGQAQSQISLKLFGELNMDDFQVNQAKDGFVWDGGLEEAFIENLRANINEYIEIAKLSTKQRSAEENITDEESDAVQEDVAKTIDKLNKFDHEPLVFENGNDTEIYKRQLEEEDSEILQSPIKDESKPRNYGPIKISRDLEYKFLVKWIEDGGTADWLSLRENEDNKKIEVDININHDFFKPYSTRRDFKVVLEKLALSFVIAEIQAKKTTIYDNDLITSNSIRIKMNNILKKLTD